MKLRTKIACIALAVVFATGVVIGCLFLFVFDRTPNAPVGGDPGGTEQPNQPEKPGGPDQPTKPAEGAPTLLGVSDVTVKQGTYCNFLSGVTARSADGEDLTARISVSGEVNTSKEGIYTLTYAVADDGGRRASAQRTVRVSANPAISEEIAVPVYTTEQPYNIAKGCSAYADATSNEETKAFDGELSTRWESEWREDVTLTVDLGAVLPVEGISIDWEAAYAKSFDLLVSVDGNRYERIDGMDDQTLTPDGDGRRKNSFTFADVEARYVRLSCRGRALPAYGYSIWEFEVFGTRGTVVPTDVYPVLFDARKDGGRDGLVAREEWLEYDLGREQSLDFMKLSWKSWLTPASYEILVAGENGEYRAVGIANLPYSGDTFSFYEPADESRAKTTVTARYVKIAMHALSFYIPAYRVTDVRFRMDGAEIKIADVTASSALDGHSAALTCDESDATYWENAHEVAPQTVDLGGVKQIGRVDLFWKGDDGRKGKYYDLQISDDGERWTTVFRQTHGASEEQSVYIYENARYLRIIDYQNTDPDRYMLEGMVVNSQYPSSSGEGKINYDVTVAFPEREVIQTENGSYVSGGTDFPTAKLIAYLDDSLRGKPVPSNDWWQSLLINDKGHNMYLNPLTAAFRADGLWLTNPGDGYFSGDNPGNGRQTIDVDVSDIRIGYDGMGKNAEVRVTDYSDYAIAAVMTDNRKVDKLTVFLSQGALYAYCLFAEPQKATLWSDGLVALYDPDGNEILKNNGSEYVGDCIVVCVRTHSGYKNNIEKDNPKEYEERFYVVSVAQGTQFVREESAVRAVMNNGNYLSVGAMSCVNTVAEEQSREPFAHGAFDVAEAKLLHEHGYAFIVGTTCTYAFDGAVNEVLTNYTVSTMCMRSGYPGEAVTAFMPHHYKKSDIACSEEYVYKTVRGDCRAYVGNVYTTRDRFYGVVPTFTEPNDGGYSAKVLYAQLLQLYANVGGDKSPEESGLISGDPYWQGKNLHPMAMAVLAADQIGAIDLRDGFLQKIRYILTDWFEYTPDDEPYDAYFYYDKEWGTLYYKNSEFGAGVNLADHHFTYGYYTLAAGVLCAYQPDFAERYGDMIELLIRDYMNWNREDGLFPYMRNYDVFAGHSWAGGYADNDGGNNQESAGEALNSWVGAYLYATAVGNEEMRVTAIYGFTTELNAIKQYWFNYGGDSFGEFYPYGTLGQLYGASNFFGTFFNGEPLYMYGIHLIPGEEFLTSYALNEEEQKRLEEMIGKMKTEQAGWNTEEAHKTIYAWQHIFIPIVAAYDADEAIRWYDEVLAEQGNVGNTSEQFNVYYIIHGLKSTGARTTDIWAENGASATVYKKDGAYSAICWNPTGEAVRYIFRSEGGVTGSALVPARSLVLVDPTQITEEFETYRDGSSVKPADYARGEGVTVHGESLGFENGRAEYLLSCGDDEDYRRIVMKGDLEGARLFVDGEEYALTQKEKGVSSAPCILTFRHRIEIRARSGTLEEIAFEKIELTKLDLAGATARASSENNAENTAQKAVDGDPSTRWESVHGSDGESLLICLPEAVEVYQMKILWEAASAAEYTVSFSLTGEEGSFTRVFEGTFSQGGNRTDTVTPSEIFQTKYILIEGAKRLTAYGYSIFEIELFGFTQ